MKDLNILFASAGRRVSLLRSFRVAIDELGLKGKIYAADAGLTAPASYVADEKVLVPRVDSPLYIDTLLSTCIENKINIVISLIDSDLTLLSQNKDKFAAEGITILVCDETTNDICFDKLKSYEFFTSNNINTPKILNESEYNGLSECDLPMMIKPWDGSCSVGVNVVENMEELHFYKKNTKNAMIQELVHGEEYTCDVYVDFDGKVRCVVPRKRLETRAGEISKGLTVNDNEIIDAVIDCVNKLPHAVGCMTVQCFKKSDSSVSFIEINPRFGGGHPLSVHAGANFPKWLIQEYVFGSCDASFDSWQDDTVMLRYDDEVFLSGSNIR